MKQSMYVLCALICKERYKCRCSHNYRCCAYGIAIAVFVYNHQTMNRNGTRSVMVLVYYNHRTGCGLVYMYHWFVFPFFMYCRFASLSVVHIFLIAMFFIHLHFVVAFSFFCTLCRNLCRHKQCAYHHCNNHHLFHSLKF